MQLVVQHEALHVSVPKHRERTTTTRNEHTKGTHSGLSCIGAISSLFHLTSRNPSTLSASSITTKKVPSQSASSQPTQPKAPGTGRTHDAKEARVVVVVALARAQARVQLVRLELVEPTRNVGEVLRREEG